VLRNAKHKHYLTGGYDGKDNSRTEKAILAFQTDNKLLGPANTLDSPGLVAPGGPTITALSNALPPEFQTMRLLPDGAIVYLEGDSADADSVKAGITADLELDMDFRNKLADLVGKMFDTHGIVLSITPSGRRRTFAKQFTQTGTNAGPGESNHNFGQASDIGFNGLKRL